MTKDNCKHDVIYFDVALETRTYMINKNELSELVNATSEPIPTSEWVSPMRCLQCDKTIKEIDEKEFANE